MAQSENHPDTNNTTVGSVAPWRLFQFWDALRIKGKQIIWLRAILRGPSNV